MTASRLARPLLWLLLALPAVMIAAAALRPGADLDELLHPSGEFAARLLIVALALTPLARLFPRSRAVAWLVRQRRAIGLAAFATAVLHTLLYLIAMGTLRDVLAEAGARGIWTGWAALALMLPLALTSNAASMRALGRGWKSLQRLAYPAALLTLLHWLWIHDGFTGAIVHFGVLALLEATRLIPLVSPQRRLA